MASVIGSLIGAGESSADSAAARQATIDALNAIKGVTVPTVEEQKVDLEQLVQQGLLEPEMLEAITQADSEMKGVSTDPRLREAQLGALDTLVKQGQTGLTDTDKAAILQVNKGIERDAKARNDAVLQNMAARGMGGSGAELAAQLMNNQAAADRAQDNGANIAAQATQRALEATVQSGQLGGQIQQQDFNQKSDVAKAQDVINQFNTANRQNVAAQNTGARNAAKQVNLQEKQRVADTNVGNRNQAQVYNKNLIQQNYQNEMGKAQNIASAQGNAANMYNNQAQQTRGMWTGIGQGVDKGITSIIGMAHGGMVEKPEDENDGLELDKRSDTTYANNDDRDNKQKVKDTDSLNYAKGGKVPGKAEVAEDSEKNDKVLAALSPGEIVLPISIAKCKDDDAVMAFINLARKK